MSFLEQGYLKTRVGGFQESLKKFLDGKKTSGAVTAQLSNATKSVGNLFERGQRSVSPTVSSLQERLNTTVGSVQDVIELVSKYDWDFDNYLEEDVPAAVRTFRNLSLSYDVGMMISGFELGLGFCTDGVCEEPHTSSGRQDFWPRSFYGRHHSIRYAGHPW